MSPLAQLSRSWNRMFDEPGSLRTAAILRIAVGPIVVIHLWPFLVTMAHGQYYADHFYSPWIAGMPEMPRLLYFALLGGCVGTAVLLSLGLFTRFASLYTFAFTTYNFFLSQTHFHNNRNFLLIALAFLALIPCGRELSLDAWRRRRAGAQTDELAPLWPLYLLRFEVLSIYLASATSKLLNPDWLGGIVTWDRTVRHRGLLEASIAPQWLIDLVLRQDFHSLFAKVAIATEFVIAFGLLFRKTRLAAIWVAIAFHAVIGIALKVEIFSYLAISALVIWVVPKTHDRTLTIPVAHKGGRFVYWCVRRLDWLDRFDATTSNELDDALELVDRDGNVLRGPAAAWFVLVRCPALFLCVAPFGLPGLRALWNRALRV